MLVESPRGGTWFFSDAMNILLDFFIISRESEGIVNVVIRVWLSIGGKCTRYYRWGGAVYSG